MAQPPTGTETDPATVPEPTSDPAADEMTRLANIEANLAHKPGMLGVFGAVLGGIGIPIGILTGAIWFVASGFQTSLTNLETKLDDIEAINATLSEQTGQISQRLDTLVVSMARATAETNSAGLYALLEWSIPYDVKGELVASGVVKSMKHSQFDNREWIFLDISSYNKLDAAPQKALEESLGKASVFFILDD